MERDLLTSGYETRRASEAAATVLVVEDDAAVRLLFSSVLQDAGFDVIACENGAQALDAIRATADGIDALVTDGRMPGLSGLELLGQIRALRPEIPAIIVSGGPVEGISGHPGAVFLFKPISPGVLTCELRRLLQDRM